MKVASVILLLHLSCCFPCKCHCCEHCAIHLDLVVFASFCCSACNYCTFLSCILHSSVLLQDLCLIDFDMENLTLTFPTETEPRCLTCKLVAAGEVDDSPVLSPDDIAKLLESGHVPHRNQVDDDEESNNQEEEADQNEGDAAFMEAENIIPPIANDPGDGVLGELEIAVQKGQDLHMPEIEQAVEQPSVHGTPPDLDDEMFINEEELCYEPTSSAHHPLPDEDPVYSSSAASSKGLQVSAVGLNMTPWSVRSMLPPSPGVKIQHRKSKSQTASSGYQAWTAPSLPSRWFSYGPKGQYSDENHALQAAVDWVWKEYGK